MSITIKVLAGGNSDVDGTTDISLLGTLARDSTNLNLYTLTLPDDSSIGIVNPFTLIERIRLAYTGSIEVWAGSSQKYDVTISDYFLYRCVLDSENAPTTVTFEVGEPVDNAECGQLVTIAYADNVRGCGLAMIPTGYVFKATSDAAVGIIQMVLTFVPVVQERDFIAIATARGSAGGTINTLDQGGLGGQ